MPTTIRLTSTRRLSVLALALLGAGAAAAPHDAEARGTIKAREHTVERQGVNLSMTEKWVPGNENGWKTNGKVILLVHGATWSSKCTFDPMDDYSLMDTLADAGYDVFAIDLHGYGKSEGSKKDWTESTAAAEDLDAASDYIRAFRWVEKVHVFGYQWGAQTAAVFAAKKANKVDKLVLFGMRHNEVKKIAQPKGPFVKNSHGDALLKPDDGDLDPEFARRRAQVCIQHDPKSPTGARRDLGEPSPVDPTRIKSATMLVMGERDLDDRTFGDRMDFFRALGARDRSFVVLKGLGKYANYEKNRGKFEQAVLAFLEQP